ncbi:MAG: hypothetical protein M3R21_02940 [Candidatus Dormibacteraeota bacterium]|nr:hypothetical protein [Candidatus Dormibacteraeota bacterium]
MKVARLVALALLVAGCSTPIPLSATVEAAATQDAAVGGHAQLSIKLTNTGPAIPHLGLVFRTVDKWYDHHTVSDFGGCTLASDASAFDCGEVAASATASFLIVGTAKDAGSFHYELVLRSLVRPFDYVNDRADGADAQIWDETVTPT